MNLSTQLVHIGVGKDPKTGAISMPIYQVATFEHPCLGQSTGYDYSRSLNPTRHALEEGMALLEEGTGAFAFASGMAAVTAVLTHFSAGDHLVVTEDTYGGTYRVLETIFNRFGLSVTFVDTTDLEAVEKAILPNTKAIMVETPTNPMVKVANLKALIPLAKSHGLLSIVDNTFMTPLYQKPLVLGADMVIHSASKYLGGHNDLIAGIVVTKGQSLTESMAYIQKSTGAILGPQDAWLLMRGIKTLALRMDYQCQNALKMAIWLDQHPAVKTVYYPGLPNSPSYCPRENPSATEDNTASNMPFMYGAMVSFHLENATACTHVLDHLKLVKFAESLGGVESLITYPSTQTHADMPLDYRNRLGIDDKLLRFSVGIEHIDDLIADYEHALKPLLR